MTGLLAAAVSACRADPGPVVERTGPISIAAVRVDALPPVADNAQLVAAIEEWMDRSLGKGWPLGTPSEVAITVVSVNYEALRGPLAVGKKSELRALVDVNTLDGRQVTAFPATVVTDPLEGGVVKAAVRFRQRRWEIDRALAAALSERIRHRIFGPEWVPPTP